MSTHFEPDSPTSLLERMMLIRAYEEALARNHQREQFPGTCTSVGQEACAVGVVSILGPDDQILTNHRSAGHLLARGADPGRLLAEVMGRSTGYCKGRSGSLHISAAELGVVLTSTIVGGELSLAPGVALAKTLRAQPGLVACFFGDGAACEGIFHESLNLASVWQLPLLYVCENNQWQAFVPRRETMQTEHIRRWAEGYGMACQTVDGNDVLAVRAAARVAAEHIRSTGRPYFLELTTYRMRGHFEPDDQAYVDRAELASWQLRDPIHRLRTRLLADKVLDDVGLVALEQRVAATLAQAAEFARSSPPATVADLPHHLYA